MIETLIALLFLIISAVLWQQKLKKPSMIVAAFGIIVILMKHYTKIKPPKPLGLKPTKNPGIDLLFKTPGELPYGGIEKFMLSIATKDGAQYTTVKVLEYDATSAENQPDIEVTKKIPAEDILDFLVPGNEYHVGVQVVGSHGISDMIYFNNALQLNCDNLTESDIQSGKFPECVTATDSSDDSSDSWITGERLTRNLYLMYGGNPYKKITTENNSCNTNNREFVVDYLDRAIMTDGKFTEINNADGNPSLCYDDTGTLVTSKQLTRNLYLLYGGNPYKKITTENNSCNTNNREFVVDYLDRAIMLDEKFTEINNADGDSSLCYDDTGTLVA